MLPSTWLLFNQKRTPDKLDALLDKLHITYLRCQQCNPSTFPWALIPSKGSLGGHAFAMMQLAFLSSAYTALSMLIYFPCKKSDKRTGPSDFLVCRSSLPLLLLLSLPGSSFLLLFFFLSLLSFFCFFFLSLSFPFCFSFFLF